MIFIAYHKYFNSAMYMSLIKQRVPLSMSMLFIILFLGKTMMKNQIMNNSRQLIV